MVKRFTLLILIGVIASSCSSSKKLDVWTKQSQIKKVKDFESKLNSNSEFLNQNVSLSESMYPRVNEFEMANPIIVKREGDGILTVYAEYFFSKPDSVLRYVSYDWENNRYGSPSNKQGNLKLKSKKLKDYNSEYERIKQQLISEFGQPNKQDTKPQETKSDYGGPDYLSRSTIWESHERFSKLSMIFGASTYRIRLYYYWK